MRDFILNMISEKGGVSSMRVMSFLSLLLGGAVSFYGLSINKDPVGLAALVGVFVGSAFGGKALQKKFELGNVVSTTKEVADAKETN